MAIGCGRVRELAPGFVLGALDPAEMAAVHEHLIGCREPHPELREFGGVLPYLAVSLEPVEPRASLRAAVIAAAQADLAAHPRSALSASRRFATIRRDAPVAEPEAVEADAAGQSAGVVVSLASARRSRRRSALTWASRVAAAVAVVAVVAYGFGAVIGPGSQPTATRPNNFTTNDTRYAVLTPQGASKAQGLVALRPSGHLLVYVNGLVATKGDQVYMVWVTTAGAPMLAGYFTVNDQGDGTVAMDNVPTAASIWVQVCIEPNDHVTRPTGPIVAVATITP
jgi:hypothetical protein